MSPLRHLLAALIMGASVLYADSPFSAKPAGLRLVTIPHEGESRMRAYNHTPGSSFVFSLIGPDSGPYVVDIDFKRSAVESAFDDSGRNLLTHGTDDAKELQERTEFWSATPKISSDGRAVLLESSIFHPLALPAKGSTEIRLKASVMVLGATGIRASASLLDSTPGQSTTVGELRFELDKIEPEGGFGETPYKMTFRVFGPMKALRDLQITDSGGNKIPRYDPLQPRFTYTGKEQFYYLDIRLAKELPESAELQVELWTDLSEYLVPIELTFALGLGSDNS